MDYSLARTGPQKRTREENYLPCLSPKRSRIAQWLSDTTLSGLSTTHHLHRRTRSAPGNFTGYSDLQFNFSEGQPFVFEHMESTEPDSTEEGSENSSEKKAKRAVSNASNYYSTLCDHGIDFDANGRQIPTQLDAFIKEHVLTATDDSLVSDQAYEEICDIREDISTGNETLLIQIYMSAMFPSKPRGVKMEGETIWDTTALPRNSKNLKVCTLVAPKSDFYLAYDNGARCPFSGAQKAILEHALSGPYAKPAKKYFFPYLVVELKSDFAGGTLIKAEYQAASGGTICVNGVRWFLKAAQKQEELKNMESSIAFSLCMNHRMAALYVHWTLEAEGENPRFVMSTVDEFFTLKIADVRRCATAIANIHKWAQGPRKEMITSTLQDMTRSPPNWLSTPTRKRGGTQSKKSATKKQKPNSATSGSADPQSINGESLASQRTGPKPSPSNLLSPPKSHEVA